MTTTKINVQSDRLLSEKVNEYMSNNKHASRKQLRDAMKTSDERLMRLQKEGLREVPPPMSRSAAATLNRKRNKVAASWYIRKPSPWQAL